MSSKGEWIKAFAIVWIQDYNTDSQRRDPDESWDTHFYHNLSRKNAKHARIASKHSFMYKWQTTRDC